MDNRITEHTENSSTVDWILPIGGYVHVREETWKVRLE